MGFYKQPLEYDFGECPVENMFIKDFMPMANGTHVKVYLLGLLLSDAEYTHGNDYLASILHLSHRDINDAWLYWEKIGLIRRHNLPDDAQVGASIAYDVEFIPLRTLYIRNHFLKEGESAANDSEYWHGHSERASAEPTPGTSTFFRQRALLGDLFQQIERTVGRPLSAAEFREIGDLVTQENASPEMVHRAFDHVYVQRRIHNLKVLHSTVIDWVSRGLASPEAIDAHLATLDERQILYKRVLKLMGLAFRMANDAEMTYIDTWVDQLNFDADTLCAILKDSLKQTVNPNFAYFDKIFKSLHEEDIHTYAGYVEAKERHRAWKEGRVNRQPGATSSSSQRGEGSRRETTPVSSGRRRKQYTVEKHRTYSEEELESLLLARGRGRSTK